ncbi:MAG: hypothetical protein KDC27_01510, partial [Acidobacteria bacterium]|nr:hypothetical protein [Acidobacteriota bacterium]
MLHSVKDSQDDSDDHGSRLARCEGRLHLLCAHLAGSAVRSRVEVEDLVQEVYLRALADPCAWPKDANALFRYLSVIARHVVIDVVRAARAAKRDGREEALDRSSWTRAGRTPVAATPGPRTRAAGSEQSR